MALKWLRILGIKISVQVLKGNDYGTEIINVLFRCYSLIKMEPTGNFNLRVLCLWFKVWFFIHKSDQRCFINNFPQVYNVILPISAQRWYSVE